MGRVSVEDLERLERALAWQQCRRSLARMTDRDLAELIATQDTAALEAGGITRELIATAVGSPESVAERGRRLTALFDLPEDRKDRLRDYLTLRGVEL